jgi:hypothetical protein
MLTTNKGFDMSFCRYYRIRISHCLDNGQELPANVGKHIQECAECENVYRRGLQVADALSAQAFPFQQKEPSPFLRARVLARLDDRPSESYSGQHRASLWLAGAATVAVVVMASLWWPRNSLETGPKLAGGNIGVVTAPAVSTTQEEQSVGGSAIRQLADLDQPLSREMESVVKDAKTAVQLLARNFVPDNVQISALDRETN